MSKVYIYPHLRRPLADTIATNEGSNFPQSQANSECHKKVTRKRDYFHLSGALMTFNPEFSIF